ncbi:MAG: YggS family pyridoxal phosphate-dependent enzyme [Alistipes sp.]|nr:YggS family pyridoxal phosphate-dependent enzyme [Alistipes sp.]
MSIATRLNELRATLPDGVTLVAVSKFHPAERLMEAYRAGQRIFGESRPQEMAAKHAELPEDIQWHMIGHLQTNKVKLIAPFAARIDSVDSERLIDEIDRQALRCGRCIDILLEVHVADEQTKSGWDIDELRAYIAAGTLSGKTGIRVRGLMSIATNTDDERIIRRDFSRVQELFNEFKPLLGSDFDTLSLGMSDDWPLAVEYGSTAVRIGTAIFGAREY